MGPRSNVGHENLTARRAQSPDLFQTAVFHMALFVFEYLDNELILFTHIAKGLCQVKKILTQVLIQRCI